VSNVGEGECTPQRGRQKLIEMAPARGTSARLRQQLVEAGVALAGAARLDNLATVEFLVAAEGGDCPFAFIEANPRLQVEHTITEEVQGVDLVGLQLDLAGGRGPAAPGLDAGRGPAPRGAALALRGHAGGTGGRRTGPPPTRL